MNKAVPFVAVLVLAAGLSRRMGDSNKLLLRLPSGKSILRTTLETAVTAATGPVLLVAGHDAAAVAQEAVELDVQTIFTPDYTQGLSASLRAGLAAVPADCAGALICLGDMPFIPPALLRDLCLAFAPAADQDIVQPTYRGQPGNPVLWGRRYFAKIMELSGDIGARHLLLANTQSLLRLEVNTPAVLADIDTPEQFAALCAP